MFGHDTHDEGNDMQGPPLPPEPINDGVLSSPAPMPVMDTPEPPTTPDGTMSASLPPAQPANPTLSTLPSQDDLLLIKQQALQQLTPLVGHLDQTPEEKFRTTMMMIQAADNQSLLGTAYEAAQQIPDDKAKAQALLDVVNEINYFTHHNEQ